MIALMFSERAYRLGGLESVAELVHSSKLLLCVEMSLCGICRGMSTAVSFEGYCCILRAEAAISKLCNRTTAGKLSA